MAAMMAVQKLAKTAAMAEAARAGPVMVGAAAAVMVVMATEEVMTRAVEAEV